MHKNILGVLLAMLNIGVAVFNYQGYREGVSVLVIIIAIVLVIDSYI